MAANWSRVDAAIDLRAALCHEEIQVLADRARDAIDIRLGFSRAFINRSRGQRRRYERQRILQQGGSL